MSAAPLATRMPAIWAPICTAVVIAAAVAIGVWRPSAASRPMTPFNAASRTGIVKAAHAAGIWVGVCGEMAGDPALVPLLLGLGVDELSTAPPVVPQIKYLIQRIDFSTAANLAAFALASESAGDILERCLQSLGDAVPGLLDQSPGSA